MVLCRRERLVSLLDVAQRVTKQRGTRIGELEPNYMKIVVDDRLTGNTATFEVFAESEPHVRLESLEIAEAFEDRPDREHIAAADARYSMIWDLRYSDETYNAMCVAAEALADASDGIVYDATNDEIVLSAFTDRQGRR